LLPPVGPTHLLRPGPKEVRIDTWKLHLPLAGEVRFTEPHATRTDVFAYGISSGQRMVLVDDEVTTGNTLTNLAIRLHEAGADPLAAVCLVEDSTGGARARLAEQGIPLIALTRIGTQQR
jgi:adenine phosphoribosyltransferase